MINDHVSDDDAGLSGAKPDPSGAVDRRVHVRALVTVLTVATIVLLATCWWFGMRVHRADRTEELRRSAVQVAKTQALTLLEVSESNVDRKLRDLLEGSTGDFKRQLQSIEKSFGDVVRKGKVASQGRIDAAGLSALDSRSATVILALSSTVTNAQTAQPEGRAYRISVTMVRAGDRWLVSGMEFAP